MNLLRGLCLVLGVFATVVVGYMLAGWIGSLIGVWDYYIAAVLLPVFGLGFAWLVAPAGEEELAAVVYLVIGIGLAWWLACPAWFPEGHPRAYERTNLPFAMTVVTGTGVCGLLLLLSRRRAAQARRTRE